MSRGYVADMLCPALLRKLENYLQTFYDYSLNKLISFDEYFHRFFPCDLCNVLNNMSAFLTYIPFQTYFIDYS